MSSQPEPGNVGDATGAYRPSETGSPRAVTPDEGTEVMDQTGAYAPDQDDGTRPGTPIANPDDTMAGANRVGDDTCDLPTEPSDGGTAAFLPPGAEQVDPGQTVGAPREGTQGPARGATQAGVLTDDAATPCERTGRYLLRKFHAKGGMGEIWMAEDPSIGRSVALKRMRGALQADFREDFLREAQVTGQLEHPGVVPVHELAEDEDGKPYYIMKFVHGRTLSAVIDEYHAPPVAGAEAKEVQLLKLLNMFVSLSQTMAYAHSRDVIHRDLKPDNVMVGAFGETLVLDWGLAKVVGQEDLRPELPSVRISSSGETMETMAGTVKGTPSYMSPEMALGKVAEIDQSSDIYLLGATLYHILTGKKPRQAKKLNELLDLARNHVPQAPRAVLPAIAKPLEAICMKAMAMRKADRYATAAALAQDVQSYLAGEPVSAYRETFTERMLRWMRKNQKWLARGAAAVLLIATVATSAFVVQDARQRQAAAQAVADELSAQERGRDELKRFRALAEEARFFAANANPSEQNAPFFDPKKGEMRAVEAFAVAQGWGPALEQLPLGDEVREATKRDLYDLLLLAAQIKSQKPDPVKAREALALLDRAGTLGTPTRAYFRLRAECNDILKQAGNQAAGMEGIDGLVHVAFVVEEAAVGGAAGKKDAKEAKPARKQADDASAPTGALDHYLQGEALRAEAARVTYAESDEKDQPRKTELLEQAAEQYRLALKHDAEHFWSLYQLGRTYMSLGKGSEAVGILGSCIVLRPRSPWAYSARGMAQSDLGRFEDAQADLEKALELDPEFRPARLNWAVARWQQKKKQRDADLSDVFEGLKAVLAEPAEKRLIEAAFFRGYIHMERGLFLAATGKPGEGSEELTNALEDLELALANKLDYPVIHLYRVRIYFAQGDAKKALESLDAYLAAGGQSGDGPQALERRARELRLIASETFAPQVRGRIYALAIADLKAAIGLGGKSATLFAELGAAYYKLGRFDLAIEAFDDAIDRDPKDVKALIKRGWSETNLKAPVLEKAGKDFEAALRSDPDNAEAHTGVGYVRAHAPLSVEARRHANHALMRKPGDYLILHNVACIYGVLAQKEPARTREYEDLTLDILRRGVALWARERRDPSPFGYMRSESSFSRQLKNRPEFLELLDQEKK